MALEKSKVISRARSKSSISSYIIRMNALAQDDAKLRSARGLVPTETAPRRFPLTSTSSSTTPDINILDFVVDSVEIFV